MSDLVGWLAALTVDDLATVLARRADAVSAPTPRSPTELAERLVHPYSVVSALVELPAPAVQVVEVTGALGAGCSRTDAAAMMGRAADDVDLGAALRVLAGAALVWPDSDDTLHSRRPTSEARSGQSARFHVRHSVLAR